MTETESAPVASTETVVKAPKAKRPRCELCGHVLPKPEQLQKRIDKISAKADKKTAQARKVLDRKTQLEALLEKAKNDVAAPLVETAAAALSVYRVLSG